MSQNSGDGPRSRRRQTKTTRLSLDEFGSIKSRPIHLRELEDVPKHPLPSLNKFRDGYAEESEVVEKSIVVRNISMARLYAHQLILALEPVVDYDKGRHHNQPPPELWVDDIGYLDELRALVSELRHLNELLRQHKRDPEATVRTAVRFKDHIHTFLDGYSHTLGKSAAFATVGLAAAVLYETGFARTVIHDIVAALKVIK